MSSGRGAPAASGREGRAVAEPGHGVIENGRARRASRDCLTIEQAAAVESPREFRLSPDGRRVAFTAEAAGARQIFLMPSAAATPSS